MKREIELKFIVGNEHLFEIVQAAEYSKHITQAFLFGSPNIRVRNIIDLRNIVDGDKSSYIIIKGEREGCVRDEFEYKIPYGEGLTLLRNFGGTPVIKTRYVVKHGKDTWEVDDFHGENYGLLLAEIEIPREDYDIDLPPWIDSKNDVHDDYRFYNSYLAEHPYSSWKYEG